MAKDKDPRVDVTANFYFKNPPANYICVTQEGWNFGKLHKASLKDLIVNISVKLIEFYGVMMWDHVDYKIMEQQIKEAGQLISSIKLIDEISEESADE